MAKITLADGTVFEGTTEELYEFTQMPNKAVAEPKPIREGDIVVITGNTNSSRNKVGDIGKLSAVGSVDVPQRPKLPGNNGNYTRTTEMRHATPSEIAEYEQAVAPKDEPLKVGDYANVVGGGNFKTGDIVKILRDDNSGFSPLLCALVSVSEEYGEIEEGVREYKNYDNIRKATDEEVETAKRKADEATAKARKEAVFTQSGRKPNEYRKGDIVMVTGERTRDKFYGEIGDSVGNDKYHFTHFGRIYHNTDKASDMTPIAFVENRLDK